MCLKSKHIESIPLKDLSFRDVYKFPLSRELVLDWVYDSQGNFIFQFCTSGEETLEKCLKILNGTLTEYKKNEARYSQGYVELKIGDEWLQFILIRGWGSLTSVGGYNLSNSYASRVQESLAEYIIEKLRG